MSEFGGLLKHEKTQQPWWGSDTEKAWTEKTYCSKKLEEREIELDQTQTQRSKQQWTTKTKQFNKTAREAKGAKWKASVKTLVLTRHFYKYGNSANRWKEVIAPKQPLIWKT